MSRLIDKASLHEQALEQTLKDIAEMQRHLLEDIPNKVESQIISQIAATAWPAAKPGRRAERVTAGAILYLTKTDRYDRDIEPFLQELEEEYPTLIETEPTTSVFSTHVTRRYLRPDYLSLSFILPSKGACTVIEETTTETIPVTKHHVVCK
jgi:hypothetical protein